ncbi:hypothetical protein T484DRAFT_1842656, partial [Baffinella frigidus]
MGRKGKGKAAKKAEVENPDASADFQEPVPPAAADEPPAVAEVDAGTVNAPAPDVEDPTKPADKEALEPAQEAAVRENTSAEGSGDSYGGGEGGHVAFSAATLSAESPAEEPRQDATAGQDESPGEAAAPERGFEPVSDDDSFHTDDEASLPADESAQPSAAPGEGEEEEALS